jgi:hypothetical protein
MQYLKYNIKLKYNTAMDRKLDLCNVCIFAVVQNNVAFKPLSHYHFYHYNGCDRLERLWM